MRMWRAPSSASAAGEGVAGVALGVVAHDRLDGAAALLAHPGRAAAQGERDVGGVLGAVQLGIDQAAVVVLDGDHDASCPARGRGRSGAVAGAPNARARSNFGAPKASMCSSAPGWLHSKRR